MKRVLLVLLGISVAMTVLGLVLATTRPLRWPGNVGVPEWRRMLDRKVEAAAELQQAEAAA